MSRQRTLFDGPVHMHYSQMYVVSEGNTPEYPVSGEKRQGYLLCAPAPGTLFLTTATHTGTVRVTVELWDSEPPRDVAWPYAVEAFFEPLGEDVALVQWAGEDSWGLALPLGLYAVRYSAAGVDEAGAAESAGSSPPDRYLLQFWPSEERHR